MYTRLHNDSMVCRGQMKPADKKKLIVFVVIWRRKRHTKNTDSLDSRFIGRDLCVMSTAYNLVPYAFRYRHCFEPKFTCQRIKFKDVINSKEKKKLNKLLCVFIST